jgi:hypothetical protein
MTAGASRCYLSAGMEEHGSLVVACHGITATKLSQGWTWPRRRPLDLVAAATSQPPRHGSGIEVGGLAAHTGNVE